LCDLATEMQHCAHADAIRRSIREPDYFRSFYDAHVDGLLAYMLRRVYDLDTALDLMAETFAQAFIGAKRFRGDSDEEAAAWLYGIGSRQLINYFRRGDAERRALAKLGLEAPQLPPDELERILHLAEMDDLRKAVRFELIKLSDEQRDALQLRIVEELSYSEVARRLGVSEPAARARVARGLKALAGALNVRPIMKGQLR